MSSRFDPQSFHADLEKAMDVHHPSPVPPTLPTPECLARASASMGPSDTRLAGLGTEQTLTHLLQDIVPALSGQTGPRYYGFVTGGVHPAAAAADAIVTAVDQNVQVHLPDATIATELEAVALDMLADLLDLTDATELHGGRRLFAGRTFTTGATASNVLGLACGRESVIAQRLPQGSASVGELGLLDACTQAGVKRVQILTSAGHSSLSKAASIVGIGRANVKEMPTERERPWLLDIKGVEAELKAGRENGVASIIAISLGEVNTGRYAVEGREMMELLSELAKTYKSWLHVDGGTFRTLIGVISAHLYQHLVYLRTYCRRTPISKLFGPGFWAWANMSIASPWMDTKFSTSWVSSHYYHLVWSWLTWHEPYDCGMFFTRSLDLQTQVFQNPNAAYLASSASATVPSPLNLGIENSRRFRALPAYAMMKAEGRAGISAMLVRMVQLARGIAAFVRDSKYYELLPDETAGVEETFMIVLFRAKNELLNDELVARINGTRDMYVSGTSWEGRKAVRVAVSNFAVDVARDLAVVTEVLTAVAEGRPYSRAS